MTETGLLPVFSCKNSNSKGNIIFIHGLGGDPWTTWHSENKTGNKHFWPFWLGETLEQNEINVNVWSFGYEVPDFHHVGETMSRFDQASCLLEYLEVNNIGDRSFIFVAHSLGGLIVKEVVRTAQNFPFYKNILEHIKGIIFLSTPHTGTQLTNLIENISFLTEPAIHIK